jgi:hypothetical protein
MSASNTSALHAAGTSIAPIGFPVRCAASGIRLCAKTPPIVPIVVIAANALAERSPAKARDGSHQKLGGRR